jgi:dGTPase
MCFASYEKSVYTNPLATLSINSRGRKRKIIEDGYRSEFQRDIHRIIYSQPFRRFRHKTQVFFLPHNDHICTRMEHVLHVASASRTIARHLKLNEDLAEAIGLSHDLGHAPFGHHGELILKDIAETAKLKISFQHEIHGLRVVDILAELDREKLAGLNLTFEVRDGIISHCGEDTSREAIPYKGEKKLEDIKERKDAGFPCTMEGCIVRIVDKIAYAGRDIEDALVAGIIEQEKIPKEIVNELGQNNGDFVGRLVEDVIENSLKANDRITMSQKKYEALTELIDFNYKNIYQHPNVERFKKQATRALQELYSRLVEDLDKSDRLRGDKSNLPEVSVYDVLNDFINKIQYNDNDSNPLIVLDFISGMTDNYVLRCLEELFVPKSIV